MVYNLWARSDSKHMAENLLFCVRDIKDLDMKMPLLPHRTLAKKCKLTSLYIEEILLSAKDNIIFIILPKYFISIYCNHGSAQATLSDHLACQTKRSPGQTRILHHRTGVL